MYSSRQSGSSRGFHRYCVCSRPQNNIYVYRIYSQILSFVGPDTLEKEGYAKDI